MTMIQMMPMRIVDIRIMKKTEPCQRNRKTRKPTTDPNNMDDIRQPQNREPVSIVTVSGASRYF